MGAGIANLTRWTWISAMPILTGEMPSRAYHPRFVGTQPCDSWVPDRVEAGLCQECTAMSQRQATSWGCGDACLCAARPQLTCRGGSPMVGSRYLSLWTYLGVELIFGGSKGWIGCLPSASRPTEPWPSVWTVHTSREVRKKCVSKHLVRAAGCPLFAHMRVACTDGRVA